MKKIFSHAVLRYFCTSNMKKHDERLKVGRGNCITAKLKWYMQMFIDFYGFLH